MSAFYNAADHPGFFSLLAEALRDIRSRRRLVGYLAQADLKRRGADTLLGNLWWVMDPLLQMVVYVVLVTIIARRPIPDYPLFIFAAILPWKWFTAAVIDATTSVVSEDRLIKHVAFPKIVLPIAATTAGVAAFAFGLIPLGLIMLLYPHRISPLLVLIPVIAAVQYVFTIAVALFVSAGNVYFRDVGNFAGHLLRLWWYLSPGLYSIAVLDEVSLFRDHPLLRLIATANPFAVLFEAYRSVIYGTAEGRPMLPDWASLGVLLLASTVLVALAMVVFKRLEPSFAKTL